MNNADSDAKQPPPPRKPMSLWIPFAYVFVGLPSAAFLAFISASICADAAGYGNYEGASGMATFFIYLPPLFVVWSLLIAWLIWIARRPH